MLISMSINVTDLSLEAYGSSVMERISIRQMGRIKYVEHFKHTLLFTLSRIKYRKQIVGVSVKNSVL